MKVLKSALRFLTVMRIINSVKYENKSVGNVKT